MIELIFVIVIIGILAAVAIPRFTATRDDAKVSQIMMNISIATTDITLYAVAKGNVSNDLSVMSDAVKSMVDRGEATLDTANKKATFKVGGVDCVSLGIMSSATNEDLNVSLIAAGSSNALCKHLQDSLNVSMYAIPLRGTSVVQ
uniref:type II secretion system protein n=1 Tax=Hydrocurvibacter sulfurireducens TaxID=3131937 RepID=UPI003F5FC4D6